MSATPNFTPSCPFPIQDYPHVLLAHGGGGKLMHQLIGKLFLPAFRNPLLEPQHDASVFDIAGQRLAFTTDSYVVRPLFFPGGDLGSLAVHGTVNDLAMARAPALPKRGLHHRGRPAHGDLVEDCLLDAAGRAKGGRANHHRRYQGRR
jgi:hydrogenase expression/formation protein HypE